MTAEPIPELILHHYALSTFSEKVRRILAFKQLPWRGVEVPVIMPKPKLMPLTGGYRRIPVLQIGADIYCDSALIARHIDRLSPERPLFPKGLSAAAETIADWADHLPFFWAVLPTFLDLLPSMPADFIEDRIGMTSRFAPDQVAVEAEHALGQFLIFLNRIEEALADHAFLLGDDFTIADAACFHVCNFTRNSARVFDLVQSRPKVMSWLERIARFEGPAIQPMSEDEALAVARVSTPASFVRDDRETPPVPFRTAVRVVPEDYGRDAAIGRLAMWSKDELAILVEDDMLGELAIHFPRRGYSLEQI